mgnify:CR=1 FL=1
MDNGTGIGARVKRKEDHRFLTGKGNYTDDINLPKQTYAYFVRSPHAHATIKKIDTSKAKKMPGVVGVFTGDDVAATKLGGLICGYELARALGVDSMFVERPTGTFELRRGFRLEPEQQVLLMEDVVTTGLSSREAIAAITAAGGEVIHAASLVDRSNGKADLGVPFTPLIRLDVPSYQPDALPPELEAIPAIKPGSRAA